MRKEFTGWTDCRHRGRQGRKNRHRNRPGTVHEARRRLMTGAIAPTRPLTALDLCDRCGAPAYVRVLLPGSGELLFWRASPATGLPDLHDTNHALLKAPDQQAGRSLQRLLAKQFGLALLGPMTSVLVMGPKAVSCWRQRLAGRRASPDSPAAPETGTGDGASTWSSTRSDESAPWSLRRPCRSRRGS